MMPPKPFRLNARTRLEVLCRDGFKCQLCGIDAEAIKKLRGEYIDVFEVDHRDARSVFGEVQGVEGLQAACSLCNQGKSNMSLSEHLKLGVRPKPRLVPEDTVDEWLGLYRAGARQLDIALKYNVSEHVVSRHLAQRGVTSRWRFNRMDVTATGKIYRVMVAIDLGEKYTDIARRLGVAVGTVSAYAINKGLRRQLKKCSKFSPRKELPADAVAMYLASLQEGYPASTYAHGLSARKFFAWQPRGSAEALSPCVD